ncbi:extracellular solute-binding protein [Brachybacterium phenoliresistens]|uniref:ABC transporter substrate-binding protein n=1 Tax=Brachybacterium phenoliresistens TaxID=396014 RepID=Z9JMM6_9MICO|nr:extracellular solute-binding protein [Brachybacterium phenoliresistens]EWS79685.1 ABC transporter substrate-binding protein [Brachybacterium phenoliresistens]
MFSRRTLLAGTALGAGALGLSACGGGSGSGSGEPLTTLKIMAPLLSETAPDPEGQLHKAIEEFVGMPLEITWVPNSSYGDRVTVTMASDNIPHIMVQTGKTAEFVQTATAGGYWDLTDILAEYPNLTPENPDVAHGASINGKTYGVFRLRDAMRASVILRKDWLAKVGLDEPVTTTDLEEIARAFTEEDPAGDGSTTYGLILPSWGGYGNNGPYDLWETWHGTANVWKEEGGTLSPAFLAPEFIEANISMKAIIDAGHTNADYATMDAATWNDPFVKGQGGIIADVSSRGKQLLSLFKEADPEGYGDKVTMVGNLKSPDGTLWALPTPGYAGYLAIPKSSVQTEEQLATVLGVMDKLSSEEGQRLLNNGIEGVNYEVEDGMSVPIESEEGSLVSSDVSAFAQIGTQSNGYLGLSSKPAGEAEAAMEEKRQATADSDLDSAVFNPGAAYVSDAYTQNGAILDQIVVDARLKFLAGQLDEAGLTSELQRWTDSGGQQVIDEMNELYQAGA